MQVLSNGIFLLFVIPSSSSKGKWPPPSLREFGICKGEGLFTTLSVNILKLGIVESRITTTTNSISEEEGKIDQNRGGEERRVKCRDGKVEWAEERQWS
ncbi:unnamed protein product [Cuscuta campestris]|uniref:Uncharacterized protein n=1 Tax=Cuscuta campestris TaxID=132261 RepID=A0A484MKD5_9ASTE|nr:unnamed protein product [Cuscuta campestris]